MLLYLLLLFYFLIDFYSFSHLPFLLQQYSFIYLQDLTVLFRQTLNSYVVQVSLEKHSNPPSSASEFWNYRCVLLQLISFINFNYFTFLSSFHSIIVTIKFINFQSSVDSGILVSSFLWLTVVYLLLLVNTHSVSVFCLLPLLS